MTLDAIHAKCGKHPTECTCEPRSYRSVWHDGRRYDLDDLKGVLEYMSDTLRSLLNSVRKLERDVRTLNDKP